MYQIKRIEADMKKAEANAMNRWFKYIICMYLLFGCTLSDAAAQNAIPNQVVDTTPTTGIKQFIHSSNIIAYGRFDTEHQRQPLGKRVEGGELVNYVQNFHVEKYLKGTGPRFLDVLSTGIEPLPDPKHPLNKVYPGPMAEGEYVCFLKRVEGNYYAIVGGWQGVYPVYEGKTTSLKGAGFPEFHGLSLKEFESKIKTLKRTNR
jgi:hypothetical protein